MLESEAANLDPILADLNREIQELRQKRLNHTLMKSSLLQDGEDDSDKEDNFEAVLLAETLISELDSPSAPAEADIAEKETEDQSKSQEIQDEMLTEKNNDKENEQEKSEN